MKIKEMKKCFETLRVLVVNNRVYFVRRVVCLFLRLGLTAVLLWAATTKLLDLSAAREAVAGYWLVPEILLLPATLFLPWAEIVGAVGLWVTRVRSAARGWVAVLLGVFFIALVSAWARGLDIRCGCFGGTGSANYLWLIARDLGLLAVLGVEYFLDRMDKRDRIENEEE
jgi:hypothetical protein